MEHANVATLCFQKDKLVQDGCIETLKTENSLLREELGTTRQDLSDSLVRQRSRDRTRVANLSRTPAVHKQARESRHEEESKILLSALEKLEAAEAVRVSPGAVGGQAE